jgi:hypothetical protein
MKNIVQEFDFKSEVTPVMMIAVLLNLVGRYVCGYLDIPNIFGDMIGTAFAAVLLGPWWGAIAGILGNAINGNFYSSYFPFGVVNVMGALVWGYYVRIANIRAFLSGNEKFSLARFLKHVIYLSVLGGLVCGVTSTVMKLSLYPPIEGSSFFFISDSIIEPHLQSIFSTLHSSILTLLINDLYRDLLDKFAVVFVALVCCYFIRFIPDAISPKTTEPVNIRLRTDSVSIFIFMLIYSAYLLVAKWQHPQLVFTGASYEIVWLENTQIIILLYSPIVLALLSFLVFGLHPYTGHGRFLEINRRRRQVIYDRYTMASNTSSVDKIRLIEVLKRKNMYGLLIAIVMWPVQNKLNISSSVPIYFAALMFLAVVYSLDNREKRMQILRVKSWLEKLRNWLSIHSPGYKSAGYALELIRELYSQQILPSTMKNLAFKRFSYFSCVNVAGTGYLSELRNNEDFNEFMVAAVEAPRHLSASDLADLAELIKNTHINNVIVLTSLAVAHNSSLGRWILEQKGKNITVLFMSWDQVLLSIEQKVNDLDESIALAFSRSRIQENVLPNEESHRNHSISAKELIQRTLPSLQNIIQRLPLNSIVFDVGAGRGRHTLFALENKCRVVAIERKAETFADLASLAPTVNSDTRLTLIEDDYLNLDTNNIGYANLVIAAGMLQHSADRIELEERLKCLKNLAGEPGGSVFIEMLLDVKWNGEYPENRIQIDQSDFETLLSQVFPKQNYHIELLLGPSYQEQIFKTVPRSFLPPAERVEVVVVEYLVTEHAP